MWKGRLKLDPKRIFLWWCNPFQRVCGIEHRRATASAPGRPPAALIQRRWCIGLVIIQGCLNEFSQSQEHVYNPGWPISSPGGLFHSTDLDWEICSLALHYFFFSYFKKCLYVCEPPIVAAAATSQQGVLELSSTFAQKWFEQDIF